VTKVLKVLRAIRQQDLRVRKVTHQKDLRVHKVAHHKVIQDHKETKVEEVIRAESETQFKDLQDQQVILHKVQAVLRVIPHKDLKDPWVQQVIHIKDSKDLKDLLDLQQ
jgi:hypothetical protein